MRTGTIKVLIVDDHPLFREGLMMALKMEDDIQVIGVSEDGESALRVIRKEEPDVVLLDIRLPVMNGLQVARQIKTERMPVAVIVLTNYDETQQVIHALRSGAMAYCSKSISPDDLVAVIRDVVRGIRVVADKRMTERELESWINDQIMTMTGTAGNYVVYPDEHYIPLSPRETEILQFVTDGLSNKEIARELGISQQTVKNHMTSILNKLNVKDRTQAAVTALKHGWVQKPGH
jgi:two-component system response regulator DegU